MTNPVNAVRRKERVTTRPRPLPVLLAIVTAGAVGLAGCASSSGHPRERSAAPAAGTSTAAPVAVRPKTDTALGVRTDAEMLFGQHAFLALQVMRSRLRGDPDFAQATQNAVAGNSTDISALISRTYGAAAAATFGRVWQSYVSSLVDYARAVAAKDAPGRLRDERALTGQVPQIAAVLSYATRGRVPAAATLSALGGTVRAMLAETDAYAARDYAVAYSLERAAYTRMVGLGTLVAAASVRQPNGTLPASFDGPVDNLNAALGALLGEHFEIAVDVMRAGYANAPDFPEAAALLNSNTQDLGGAIGVLFGPAAGKKFAAIWAYHVDHLVNYTKAVATGDSAAKTAAIDDLHTFEKQLSTFLAGGTDGRLTSPSATQVLLQHDTMLVQQVNDYAAKNYDGAADVTFEGYQHMYAVAATLSTAIGPAVAAKLPRGGVLTGGGGTAR